MTSADAPSHTAERAGGRMHAGRINMQTHGSRARTLSVGAHWELAGKYSHRFSFHIVNRKNVGVAVKSPPPHLALNPQSWPRLLLVPFCFHLKLIHTFTPTCRPPETHSRLSRCGFNTFLRMTKNTAIFSERRRSRSSWEAQSWPSTDLRLADF